MSWFTFSNKLKIYCCYCAQAMRITPDTQNCVHCGATIPHGCKEFSNARPFFVPMMGWTGAGKTNWLLAVIDRLETLAGHTWRDFAPLSADQVTMEACTEAVKLKKTKQVPPATEPVGTDPLPPRILVLNSMPRWGSRTFVTRDCPGESFGSFTIGNDQVQFLRQSQVAFCMISLTDLWNERSEEYERRSMEQILQSYVNTLGSNGNLRRQRRKFIVILSKADEMESTMPPRLSEYLLADPLNKLATKDGQELVWDDAAMANYMEELAKVSDEIRNWLFRDLHDGKLLVTTAKHYNIDLRFTVVSSLGGRPDDYGKLQGDWTPYRVLDPLFWALDFHRT